MKFIASHYIPPEVSDPKEVLGYIAILLMKEDGFVTCVTREVQRPTFKHDTSRGGPWRRPSEDRDGE